MVPLTRLSVAPIGWLEAVLTTAIVLPFCYKSFSDPLALLNAARSSLDSRHGFGPSRWYPDPAEGFPDEPI
jgi:hypothetical protein